MMIVEQSVECELAGETEVLGEKAAPVPLCPPKIPHDLTCSWVDALCVWGDVANVSEVSVASMIRVKVCFEKEQVKWGR
jgi:hypothetical protein